MAEPRITIIGLGLIGGSIGMAIKASGKPVHVVGHDKDFTRNRLAKKMGAIDGGSINLINACQDASLVIIATPLTAIRETLSTIGPHLKQGCVVTDTATLKEPVLAWAAETLPPGVSFIGGDPMLNLKSQSSDSKALEGLESARADLFQDALYALCPASAADPKAVKLMTDLTGAIKARPLYMDPVEHDGLRAAVRGLTGLVSLALMRQAAGAPSWREARKIAGLRFSMATESLADDVDVQRDEILLNAGHLLPRLEALIGELRLLGEWLRAEDADALGQVVEGMAAARDRWLFDSETANWEDRSGEMAVPGVMDSFGRMLGMSRGPRKPEEK